MKNNVRRCARGGLYRHAWFVLCLGVLAAGCENSTVPFHEECTEDAQCAGRVDGRTVCYLEAKVCVPPSSSGPSCNGFPEAGEVCDGIYIKDNKWLCSDWDSQYVAGKVKCTQCAIDYSDCLKTLPETCNGVAVDADEECDGEHFRGAKACAELHPNLYRGGDVYCNGCRLQYDRCVPVDHSTCDGATVDKGEDCDGTHFRDDKTTCAAWYPDKFNKGDVACDKCKLNIDACKYEAPVTCNGAAVDNGEACDGTHFRDDKTTCAAWYPDVFNYGDVGCTEDCRLDIGACRYVVPDTCDGAALEDDEDCDGEHFRDDKTTCAAWYPEIFNTGNVGCNKCKLDISECRYVPPELCNGAALDKGEDCDGTHFRDNKTTCAQWYPEKFNKGNVACNGCSLDISACEYVPPTTCDGNQLENGEVCDGTHFRDDKTTCEAWYPNKFNTGDVACDHCRLDISDCEYVAPVTCNGAALDNDEDCDGSHFRDGKTTCAAWFPQFNTGNVGCTDNCRLDLSECQYVPPETCNGVLDNGEDCDGEHFREGKTTCAQWYPDQFNSGDVSCNKCKLDISACAFVPSKTCDGKKLDSWEVCDGTHFLGAKTTCEEWYTQFNTGDVGCTDDCRLDLSKCEYVPPVTCNGEALDNGEDCDGEHFRGGKTTCEEWYPQFNTGNVGCTDDCRLDLDGCSFVPPDSCDGVLNDDEDCDGSIFRDDKKTCEEWYPEKFNSGNVTCNHCKLDISACTFVPPMTCDGKELEDGEVCDGELFRDGKVTCAEWYPGKFNYGGVSCDEYCRLDITRCESRAVCDNGVLEEGEDCDGGYFRDNKLTCAQWDPENYTQGTLKCTNCKADLTSCSTCNGKAVDEGEECDGNHFLDDKISCSAWDNTYKYGTVTCNSDCTINYDSCAQDCPSDMEWSTKYHGCVYPIATQAELFAMSNKWNAEGIEGFQKIDVNGNQKPVFVLKADIDLVSGPEWTSIGNASYPFEGVFDGNKKTLTVSKGLFGYIRYSNVLDLNLSFSYARALLANESEFSEFENIDLTGKAGYMTDANAGLIFHRLAYSTVKNLSVVYQPGSYIYSGKVSYVGLLAYQTIGSLLSDIRLKADMGIQGGHYDTSAQHIAGLAAYTEGDVYTNVDLQINFDPKSYSSGDYNYLYFLFVFMGDTPKTQDGKHSPTKVDRIKVTGGVETNNLTDSHLLWLGQYTDRLNSQNTISNLYADLHYSKTNNEYCTLFRSFISGSILFSNAYIHYNMNGVDDSTSPTNSEDFKNTLFSGYTRLNYTIPQNGTVYTYQDDPAPTAELLNANLRDGANKGIPAGTYLPWKTADDDRVVLDWDAAPSELIVVE